MSQITKHRVSVTEYYAMVGTGELSENDRVELIEGEVLEMSPIGVRHTGCIRQLIILLSRGNGVDFILDVQNPIRLDDHSEPEPDISVLRLRPDRYINSQPTAADVLLLIEVADSSILYDRNVKIPLYSRMRIPEVWLVNLINDTIEVCTQPVDDSYQTKVVFGRGEIVVSPTLPMIQGEVNQIIG